MAYPMTDEGVTPAQRGAVMVWGAFALFALAKSVIHILTEFGAQNLVDGRNPITFCNVLFAGNVVAAVTLFLLHREDWTEANLRRMSKGDWISIAVMGLLSGALAPAFGFIALAHTSVSNVVFLGRVEPILFLVLAMVFLGARPDRWAVVGAMASAFGVVTILYLQGLDQGGFHLGKGEFYAILTAVTLAIGTILSKIRLSSVPFGIFCVLRMVIGATIYFAWVIQWYGWEHFIDLLAPVLWQWMVIYGVVIVAGGQILFLRGIKLAEAQDVTLAAAFSPILAVFFAFVLLCEEPSRPVQVGGAIIMAGILTAQCGSWYSRRRQEGATTVADMVEAEGRVTFRGA